MPDQGSAQQNGRDRWSAERVPLHHEGCVVGVGGSPLKLVARVHLGPQAKAWDLSHTEVRWIMTCVRNRVQLESALEPGGGALTAPK